MGWCLWGWGTSFIRCVSYFILVNLAGMLALAEARAEPFKILAFGDSLTAGYNLNPGDGFTDRLEFALKEAGHDVQVINAGVSGDTTTGGLARIDWSLADNPDMVILELGANDGLRGLDPVSMEKNLDQIITAVRNRNIALLLAGMYAPPNMGPSYGDQFNAVFPRLAEKHAVVLYPFFLEGVAGDPALNLDDGIHPNRAGIDVIVKNILPYVLRVKNAS